MKNLLASLQYYLMRFCLWQIRAEYDIGSSFGMNPRYLHQLRADIVKMETDLNRWMLNHA